MKPIAFDTECFYSNDVSIKPLGAWAYVRHPQADHYLLTVDDGTGNVWAGRPETFDWDQLRGSQLLAHNMSYDEVVLGALVEQGKAPAWVLELTRDCTADLSAYCHSERSLLDATRTLAPDLEKPIDKSMRTFMKGRTWADAEAAGKAPALLEYAKNDARACRELWMRHETRWPEFERQLSRHTRTVGQRGMHVDVEKVETYRKALELAKWEAERRIPWAGDFPPLSPKQLAQACAQANIPAPVSTAEDNPECEKWEAEYGERFDWVAAMRDWRKTNKMLTQVQTIQRRIRPDGTMPIGLKYFGAHTGRWSGESGFNMQNLPREATYGVDLRSVFTAPPGHSLVICDLSQIEPRVLAWLAGDTDMLRNIRNGMAIYEAHARATMGWTGGELKKEDKKLYSLAKARCVAEGTLVLTHRGYTPIEAVEATDLVWDGEMWVSHRGVVCNGEKSTTNIAHEGYTADHLIFLDQSKAVQAGSISEGELAEAVGWRQATRPEGDSLWRLASAIGLVLAREGRKAARVQVHALWARAKSKLAQLKSRKVNPVRSLRNTGSQESAATEKLGSSTDPAGEGVGRPVAGHLAKMLRSISRSVSALWGKGDPRP